jgi:putative ABC transport system permease protein
MTGILRVSLRSVAAHKARLALSTLAVVLGVTFIAGTLVFSDTINASFTRLFTATAPDVTVTPRLAFTPEVEDLGLVGDIPALSDSAVRTVAGVPGVAAANGDVTVSTTTVVDARNTPIGPTTGAPTLARNWYPSAHSPTLVEGRAPTGPGEIAVDATSAARHDVHLGDPLRVITPKAGLPVTVVGLTDLDGPNPGVAMIYLDTPTAQAQLLGKPGQFSAVTVDAAPGTSDTDLRQHLQAALGPNYAISIKEDQAQSSAAQISAFLNVVTYALLGFAGIAVVVGIFGILNTFSMLVAARTRELGLLRALGASRRQVTGMVLVEGLLLGLAGATIGLGAGIGLATLLKAVISRFGVDLSGTSLVISPLTPAAAYTVGIGVTVLAAYLPARRAARVSPMAALREASAPRFRRCCGAAWPGRCSSPAPWRRWSPPQRCMPTRSPPRCSSPPVSPARSSPPWCSPRSSPRSWCGSPAPATRSPSAPWASSADATPCATPAAPAPPPPP